MSTAVDKGGHMEEVLREYFLSLGYFVVRGAKYVYLGIDITDVDLWLYQRASIFSRQRLNVDIKNRKIPHALERILWTKGLQTGLRLDGSIVATTDSRQEVKSFGEVQNVAILDGHFLAMLDSRYGGMIQRIAEEELLAEMRSGKADRIGAEWVDRLTVAKGRVLTQLDFDGYNSLLNDAHYFMEQIQLTPHKSEAACRALYIVLSLSLIVLDFLVRDFAFINKNQQGEVLNDGLRFGSYGKAGADKVFSMAGKMVSAYMQDENVRGANLTKQLKQEANKLPVGILTEFFLKIGHGDAPFDLARSLEEQGFSRQFLAPVALSPEQRSYIGAILDFFGIDRIRFFDAIKPSSPPTPSGSSVPPASSRGVATKDVPSSPQQLEIQAAGMESASSDKPSTKTTPVDSSRQTPPH